MKAKKNAPERPPARSLKELAKGQIWKLPDSHIEILEIGKRLTHYRHFRTLDAKRVPIQLTGIQTIQAYLKTNKAVLIQQRPQAR
jgi:hypothetical protein